MILFDERLMLCLCLQIGMGSALDTFCGQSYGAKQYHMLGVHKQRAMIVLLLTSVPLALIWTYAAKILLFFGQDPEIATEAGSYARFMTPSIFAYGLLQCHIRFLQAQNNVLPMMVSTGITTLLHILVCWTLVFKSGLGNKGAALANAISLWTNVLLLAIYVRVSPSCKETWTGFSKEAFHGILGFLRLGVPSAVMLWYVKFFPFPSSVLMNISCLLIFNFIFSFFVMWSSRKSHNLTSYNPLFHCDVLAIAGVLLCITEF